MLEYVLLQTAECIAASAVDFIKAGRTIPGIRIEGRWDPVLGGQRRYDVAVATTPHTVAFLNSLSLEARTAALLNLFATDPRYECAQKLHEADGLSFPDNAGSLRRVCLEGSHCKNLVMLLIRLQLGRTTAPAAVTLSCCTYQHRGRHDPVCCR